MYEIISMISSSANPKFAFHKITRRTPTMILFEGDKRWIQLSPKKNGQEGEFLRYTPYGYVFKIGNEMYEVNSSEISTMKQSRSSPEPEIQRRGLKF
jgi:hypothetical protein